MTTQISISRQDMLDCHSRIEPHVYRTPVMTSRQLNEYTGAELFFKCENFQRTGSFKMRGATNAVLSIPQSDRNRGVVAHSSGNFAQAVALAAQIVGVEAWIVMPANAPLAKVDAVKSYGGNIIMCEPTAEARELEAARVVSEKGANFLHPSNDLNVIMGQGTAGMELLQQRPGLDVLVTPVGGGGLVAGCALAAHYFGGECQTVGGEPMAADDAWRSLQSGKIEFNETTNTIADGLRTFLGDNNFPIIQEHVERIIRVDEDEIINAMRWIWERMKIICEPSCAVPLAAILREKEHFAGKQVGLVLSGGNVDLDNLPFG
ncbi:MAG: threonine/serine dehydratase [Planctomycetaceae bacterium]|nr:threonine/serine dehydratase [Planctomycetaceae bacterium]MCP4194733.1 threonine/serine dehydratase [Planctomycetaceae bacterium]MCP4464165.1 threonine/serine dehydratase [Planctomycetaceae bacterium]MDG1809044.1 threonine/serine dehydratase [Pirellulaceae bacterium]MDG2104015.1 threonine/serine dehydratase [Pirellulaceae bacterium]